ncbi:MAG: hypothetical protein L3J03_10890 [Desulfobacterales bacterium]|nr:hypothetical protein [Desulfobacterales bacterium]
MARIIYGVHGTGRGHAMRALTMARYFSEHEFLFVSHSHGAALLRQEFSVEECPNPSTPVRSHRVDIPALIAQNLKVLANRKKLQQRVVALIEGFQPTVALSDYEFFVPRASRQVGLPCLSLDHQHIVTCCRHQLPVGQLPDYFITSLIMRQLFSQAGSYIVTSFFRPPVTTKLKTWLLPPLLRESVLKVPVVAGDHVLAYHGYSTANGFFEFLRNIPRPVFVYGADREHTNGNLHFKKRSEHGFLRDLATSSYVVGSAGQTLISEALFYGKPLIVFPIKQAFEQFLNAFYVEKLGYGRYYNGFGRHKEDIQSFEGQLDNLRYNINQVSFCGNQEVFSLVRQFIDTGEISTATAA